MYIYIYIYIYICFVFIQNTMHLARTASEGLFGAVENQHFQSNAANNQFSFTKHEHIHIHKKSKAQASDNRARTVRTPRLWRAKGTFWILFRNAPKIS